jgi:hypothetical protein
MITARQKEASRHQPTSTENVPGDPSSDGAGSARLAKLCFQSGKTMGKVTSLHVRDDKRAGGEGGIRTLDTGFALYNSLAKHRASFLRHVFKHLETSECFSVVREYTSQSP